MTIEKFRQRLKEFDSKVVISPLSEIEVSKIESILERKLPEYYREFLLNIGLKQDVIWGINDRVSDFNPLTNFLPNGESKNYFRFGHNGGEDYWLLRSDDPNDRTIYEYDYYCNFEIKSLNKTFDDLLDEAIQNLEANQDDLTENSQKIWAVQFSIDTDNVDLIIESLKEDFGCEIIKEIEKTEVSSAGVICSEGVILINGVELPISKQEYSGWNTASFSFDWNESVIEMNENSLINRIENKLKSAGLKVTLIDYGIMDL
ncbi:hypothetical protein FUAX_10410 [Fulvitalea axinellae]|uniref:Knr4/Smi1-like domain-containing protein n=1 Tax=Fulvitalea axinellae TaxID=1182444 RepID=A0AAU9C9B1_9BACT|nr:hypothetical protein FUAX_10410 [Fulvitalea axinellae]